MIPLKIPPLYRIERAANVTGDRAHSEQCMERAIVHAENEMGATVFCSDHNLKQIEAGCDRISILRKGEVVTEDTTANSANNSTRK